MLCHIISHVYVIQHAEETLIVVTIAHVVVFVDLIIKRVADAHVLIRVAVQDNTIYQYSYDIKSLFLISMLLESIYF